MIIIIIIIIEALVVFKCVSYTGQLCQLQRVAVTVHWCDICVGQSVKCGCQTMLYTPSMLSWSHDKWLVDKVAWKLYFIGRSSFLEVKQYTKVFEWGVMSVPYLERLSFLI